MRTTLRDIYREIDVRKKTSTSSCFQQRWFTTTTISVVSRVHFRSHIWATCISYTVLVYLMRHWYPKWIAIIMHVYTGCTSTVIQSSRVYEKLETALDKANIHVCSSTQRIVYNEMWLRHSRDASWCWPVMPAVDKTPANQGAIERGVY